MFEAVESAIDFFGLCWYVPARYPANQGLEKVEA